MDTEHKTVPSMQTRTMMTAFKTMMGDQNYMILNALRHKAENKEKEREVTEQDNTQEDATAGPSRAQDIGGWPQPVILQQTDGVASSTPSP